MKLRITVWTLSWDTTTGTGCRVFGSESERFAYFREVIEAEIRDVHEPAADAIRNALASEDLGSAYELWQGSYKYELDTYNWDEQDIEIDAAEHPSLASSF